MEHFGGQSHNCIPAHRERQATSERARAKRRTIAERNGKYREPRNERRAHDKPLRQTRKQSEIKCPLSYRSDEETVTCDAERVHHTKTTDASNALTDTD